MLALPRLGCINLHGSLLPKYRGAAPIQWAVAMGDAYTGNTTMLLEEGLDTGPILLQQTVAIAPEQTAADLFDVMAEAGAPLVVETLAGLASGTIHPQPQNHAFATFAPLLVHRMEVADARGLDESSAADSDSAPGRIRVQNHRLLVCCAEDTWLELVEVQLEGKKRLTAAEFLRGTQIPAYMRLG